jgi:hypothetical protein
MVELVIKLVVCPTGSWFKSQSEKDFFLFHFSSFALVVQQPIIYNDFEPPWLIITEESYQLIQRVTRSEWLWYWVRVFEYNKHNTSPSSTIIVSIFIY